MLGTLINVVGIVLGGLVGLLTGRNLSPAAQQQTRTLFTALTLLTAGTLAWSGFAPPWTHSLKQIVIATFALCAGNLVGRGLNLQRGLTRLIRWAGGAGEKESREPSQLVSFGTQAVAFAGNPLGIAGAIVAGWTGDWRMLALKTGLDTMGAWGFAAAGGRSVMLASVPVAAVQGTLTLVAAMLATRFPDPALGGALRVTGGLLVLLMTPVVFGWRQVPLANYLPAIPLALLLSAWWF